MTETVGGAEFQHGYVAPAVDEDSRPWWDALAEGRLLLPRCLGCGRHWFPPGPACPECGSAAFEWTAASGRGRLYSWVVIHRALHPAFAEDVPYTIGAVELDEGPRVFGRLVGVDLAPGAGVDAVIYVVRTAPLLGFRPAR